MPPSDWAKVSDIVQDMRFLLQKCNFLHILAGFWYFFKDSFGVLCHLVCAKIFNRNIGRAIEFTFGKSVCYQRGPPSSFNRFGAYSSLPTTIVLISMATSVSQLQMMETHLCFNHATTLAMVVIGFIYKKRPKKIPHTGDTDSLDRCGS